ncbi:hypothetical protein HN873_070304 [Arachis hypogaea]
MTYVVLKGYLHDPIDCVKRAVAMEPERIYRKDVLVSDFSSSVSSFFRDELLAPVLHFVSVLWTKEKGSSATRGK